MTKIHGTKADALRRVTAQLEVADKKLEKLRQNYDQLRDAAKVELLDVVIAALEEGVPALQVATVGLKYKQTNGIRSMFGLPMTGNLLAQLRQRRAELSGSELLGLTTAEGEETQQVLTESIVYETDSFQGQPTFKVERPGIGTLGSVVDGRSESGAIFYRSTAKVQLNAQEKALLYAAIGLPEDFPEELWRSAQVKPVFDN